MKNPVLLAQTDTTVGFLSRDAERLDAIKQRPAGKAFLKVYADLDAYKADAGRIPPAHRKRLRRAKKSTFVVKNRAFRIVAAGDHHALLKNYGWLYSTSANLSGHGYERAFCVSKADIIVEDNRGLHECPPSSIIKLGKSKQRRLR